MTELNLDTMKSIAGAGAQYCAHNKCAPKNDCKNGKDCS